MNVPRQIPTTTPDPRKENNEACERLLGLVRDVRAEAQNLLESLDEIKKRGGFLDPAIRIRELELALANSDQLLAHNHGQIEQLFAQLRDHIRRHPSLHNRVGDEITQMENAWDRFRIEWQKPLNADQIIDRIAQVEPDLSEMVWHAGLVAIPSRVNEHLAQKRIGQTLDFHEAFRDELPRQEERCAMLRYMNAHPIAIEGVVSVDAGTIVHASKSRVRQAVSYALIVLFVLLGGAIAVATPEIRSLLGKVNPYADREAGEMLATLADLSLYGLVVLGSIVHIGIDGLKQATTRKDRDPLAIQDWLLWIHIREASIIVSVITLWVGFLGATLILDSINPQTFFLVGYSIDSFADLFLNRFTATTSARALVIKQQASVA